MKHSIISIIVLTLAALSAAGQSVQQSSLVDSFGPVSCGDAQARTDHFISELENNPGVDGLINVNPDAADPVPAFVILQEITSQFRARRFDESRINILISVPRGEMSIQFLKDLPGDSSRLPEPDFPPAEYDLTPVPKPVKFGSSVPAEGPVCGSNALDLNVYSLAVSQIPFVKPRVIVKAKNAARAKTIRAEMREELEKRMEPGSITWLNTKSVLEGVELWLMPEKRTASELAHGSALRDIERYSGEIKKYPNDADAYMGRAKAFEKVDRPDDAIEDLTQAIALSKHPYYVAQSTTDRGEVYLRRGRYREADADFSAVIGLAGADAYKAGAYLNRARSLSSQGKRTEALKDANEAIRLYSTRKGAGSEKRLGEAFGLRASINCAVGNRKAASADAVKAASLGAPVKRCTGK